MPGVVPWALAAATLVVVLAIIWRVALVRSQRVVSVPTTDAPARPGAPVLSPGGVYVPSGPDASRPIPVLRALHGQAGSGPGIAQRVRPCAEQHRWLLIAPTMAYRDYFDPDQVRLDAEENLPQVHALLARLRTQLTGVPLQGKLLLYGFSRGAQMAHRFTLAYPQEVAAVAALSAGSYTLPEDEDPFHTALHFPFGVADVEAIAGAPGGQHRVYRGQMSRRGPRQLRALLAGPDIVVAPGVDDALGARIAQAEGFWAVYMSGNATSAARIGRPRWPSTRGASPAPSTCPCSRMPIPATATRPWWPARWPSSRRSAWPASTWRTRPCPSAAGPCRACGWHPWTRRSSDCGPRSGRAPTLSS